MEHTYLKCCACGGGCTAQRWGYDEPRLVEQAKRMGLAQSTLKLPKSKPVLHADCRTALHAIIEHKQQQLQGMCDA